MNIHAPSLVTRVPIATSLTDLVALAKPRITLVVLSTTLGGLFMAPGRAPLREVLAVVLGTCLIVGGANALNMYLERDSDRNMKRTAKRPLPAGRMAPWVALAFGLSLSALALPVLWLGASPASALLAVVANVSYVLLYTPLKARSWLAVWVGAVPGAIPPLLGWAAATGSIGLPGLALFGILFFWQVPHFHAIALFREEDYTRAGLQVLPAVRGTAVTKRHIVFWTAVLVVTSLAPYALHMVSGAYLLACGALGGAFFGWAVAGLRASAGVRWARSFFGVSMPYLVFLFVALLVTRR